MGRKAKNQVENEESIYFDDTDESDAGIFGDRAVAAGEIELLGNGAARRSFRDSDSWDAMNSLD